MVNRNNVLKSLMISEPSHNNVDFQTPINICNLMVEMIPNGVSGVLEPTPGRGNLVNALNNYHVTAPDEFWDTEGFFECVVMNPPFSPPVVGYEILYKCMGMSNNIIALMPWLTIINSTKRTRNILDYGLKSITHLPRSTFKGSRVQTCILELSKGWKGGCNFSALNHGLTQH